MKTPLQRIQEFNEREARAQTVKNAVEAAARKYLFDNYGVRTTADLNAKFPPDMPGRDKFFEDVEKAVSFDRDAAGEAAAELEAARAARKAFTESLVPKEIENRDEVLRHPDLIAKFRASEQEFAPGALALAATVNETDPVGELVQVVHKDMDVRDARYERGLQLEAERMLQKPVGPNDGMTADEADRELRRRHPDRTGVSESGTPGVLVVTELSTADNDLDSSVAMMRADLERHADPAAKKSNLSSLISIRPGDRRA